MNILITGCAGFVGFHLSNHLSNIKSLKIYGVDNFSSISERTQILRKKYLKKNKKIFFNKIDISNQDLLIKKFRNIKLDFVVHLAAQPGVRLSQKKPINTVDQNIKNFVNILEFCNKKKVKNLFYASSSSVYGLDSNFRENQKLLNTTSIYAATKLSNEIIASTYQYLYNINSLGLRFFTIYGPFGREDMVYFKFLNQIQKSNRITVYGDSKSSRSFTYIDDVVKSLELLIKKYVKKKNYNEFINIGNSNSYSLKNLIEIIEEKFDKNFKKVFLKRNKSDLKKTFASTKKLKKIINFTPKTKLKDGMIKFITWYKNYYNEK